MVYSSLLGFPVLAYELVSMDPLTLAHSQAEAGENGRLWVGLQLRPRVAVK